MNTTLLAILMVGFSGLFLMQINNLQKRVDNLEVDLDALMTALEKAIKINENKSK